MIETLQQTAGMLKSFLITNNLVTYITVNQTINLGMSLHHITNMDVPSSPESLPAGHALDPISPFDPLSSPISPANSPLSSNNIAVSFNQRQELESLHMRITLQDSGLVIMLSSAHSFMVY
jgi:hypothetical protein